VDLIQTIVGSALLVPVAGLLATAVVAYLAGRD
jgi:hypothetical protein